jgi:uncharacterized membrane protein YoaK (UPF0700 family)
LLFAAMGGELEQFGLFGTLGLRQNYLLLVLLCLSCGLQNAAVTASSGRSVRVTHLTGLTTDLGLGLARIFTLELNHKRSDFELRANYLRMGSILAFVIGSGLGAFIFINLGYRGFIFPALISIYAAWHGRNAKKSQI